MIWNRVRPALRSALASNVTGVLALCLALWLALATGIVGMGRDHGGRSGMDLAYLYAAGRCWINGVDPYDPPALEHKEGAFLDGRYFFYPPQIGFLSVVLGGFSFQDAKIVMRLINLGCVFGLSWLCIGVIKRESGPPPAEPGPQPRWFVPAILLASPFTSHVLFMGQTSLVAATALYGGWILAAGGKWLPGGALLGIATIKPQLAFIPILWLMLERQWKPLVVGAITSLTAALPGIRVSGVIGVYRAWLGTLDRVSSCPDSVPGAAHVFSLHNAISSAGILLPTFVPLALAAAVLLWWYRSRFVGGDILALLLCISMLLGFSTDYDLIVLAPLIPTFWRHLRERDGAAGVATGLMLLLFLPQRFLRNVEIPAMQHFRVLVLLGIAIWLFSLSRGVKRQHLRAPASELEPV